jgi:Hypothetical protein (DUF2513)
MKRDMDFIRGLLLKIEGGQTMFQATSSEEARALGIELEQPMTNDEARKLYGHLALMEEAGLLREVTNTSARSVLTTGLTWAGHDFLDSVRDEEVWQKTKSAASHVSDTTFGVLKDLAVAYSKMKITELTGVSF